MLRFVAPLLVALLAATAALAASNYEQQLTYVDANCATDPIVATQYFTTTGCTPSSCVLNTAGAIYVTTSCGTTDSASLTLPHSSSYFVSTAYTSETGCTGVASTVTAFKTGQCLYSSDTSSTLYECSSSGIVTYSFTASGECGQSTPYGTSNGTIGCINEGTPTLPNWNSQECVSDASHVAGSLSALVAALAIAAISLLL